MSNEFEEQRVAASIAQAQPTDRDRENARIRQEIAARQVREYAEAERLTQAALGPGWTPWMKLLVVDSDYQATGNFEPVVTVYKVYQGERRLTENAVYLRRMPDGQIRQARDSETLLGDVLQEPHPTRTFSFRGEQLPCPRYSLYWTPLERYQPKTAEQLAVLRACRERNKAERAEKKWAKDHPLLAWAEAVQREEEANKQGQEGRNFR